MFNEGIMIIQETRQPSKLYTIDDPKMYSLNSVMETPIIVEKIEFSKIILLPYTVHPSKRYLSRIPHYLHKNNNQTTMTIAASTITLDHGPYICPISQHQLN